MGRDEKSRPANSFYVVMNINLDLGKESDDNDNRQTKVTTERTSKTIKKRMLVGCFVFIIGLMGVCASTTDVGVAISMGAMTAGGIYYVTQLVMRWWHHG